MCGIAGIIQLNTPVDILTSKAVSMANAIEHRGPDSSGVWCSPTSPIALSHRRLAILDLSPSGHQPMRSKSGNSVIAFNGEIYNFKKIKQELEKAGEAFLGNSDTEVLLSAIEAYGFDSAISQAKGMFAISYWDEKSSILKLARDRVGEKPLYYGVINNTFFFASELKAIYELFPAKQLTINKQALNSFLRYGYISAPQTIFNEINKLPPGHLADINVGNWLKYQDDIKNHIEIQKYWSILDCTNQARAYEESNTNEAINDLDELLGSIINEQSASDVPLGSFLSGGIDSTLVTSILQAQSSTSIETFTIGFHEKEFNEAVHAKAIAKHLGTNHNELYLSATDALDTIPLMAQTYDEPFSDSSQIPTYLVSKFARSKLTVCLSGDGGDELFCGYNRYIEGQRFNNITQKTPKPLRQIISATANSIPLDVIDKVYAIYNKIKSQKGGANFALKFRKAAAALKIENADELYQYLCSYTQQPSQIVGNTQDTTLASLLPFENNFLDSAMAWDQQWYIPGDNLVKSDRASMAVSLEMRVPLLDRELIEFSWRVPNSMKYRDGKSKWLLRQLLYKYVPPSLIDRPKMGFSIPIGQWIRNDLRDWSLSLLSKEVIEQQDIFNYAEVNKILSSHMSGHTDNSNILWSLLMFQSWYQHYCT